MANRAVTVLGLLLCMLVFSLAENELDTTNEPDIGKTTASDNKTWSCPEGWITYETQDYCFSLVNETKTFFDAESHCESRGGYLANLENKDKENFVRTLAFGGGQGNYWIGLFKPREAPWFYWKKRNIKTQVSIYTRFVECIQRSRVSREYVHICCQLERHSREFSMENASCDTKIFSICERELVCKPGYFGNKCEQECHCKGEPCDSQLHYEPGGVTCKFGCQRNWKGAACDTEKQVPELKYYCINSEKHGGKYVAIMIYTKGVEYSQIYGLTSNTVRGDWCKSTTVNIQSANLTLIIIPVNNISIAQMSSGQCPGEKLGADIFSWEIVLNEVEDVLQSHDAQFNVTCDFSVADNLVLSAGYSLDSQDNHIQRNLVSPESTQNDVLLEVIKASTRESVSEAVAGTPIILQMEYGLLPGSPLRRIQPHSCMASSSDGKHVKQLLGENGCPVSGSPVRAFSFGSDKKIRTPVFNIFAFEGATSVTFQCSFYLCILSDCEVGCRLQSRKQRDTQNINEGVRNSATRTIRVLPSIPAKGDRQTEDYQPARPPAAPPGHDMGPFVYINPVTCSLFLLILLVFLCMYIAFTRTLRKSIYDIRKEVEVKRSRDKFLHCGCLQQKGRDYVAS